MPGYITLCIDCGYCLCLDPGLGLLVFQFSLYPLVEKIIGPIMVSRIAETPLPKSHRSIPQRFKVMLSIPSPPNRYLNPDLLICRVEDILVEGFIEGSVVHFQRARAITVHSTGMISTSDREIGSHWFSPQLYTKGAVLARSRESFAKE
ncbi:Glycine-rich protein [Forsythia ovata]|uniref:Glycine-rich protein n=1 Tax=Forsythia ovata TaxID=205694 RepID=A0ABD1P1E1_9LAMI